MDGKSEELYIQDIMRGGIRNDDPRIPRYLSKVQSVLGDAFGYADGIGGAFRGQPSFHPDVI